MKYRRYESLSKRWNSRKLLFPVLILQCQKHLTFLNSTLTTTFPNEPNIIHILPQQVFGSKLLLEVAIFSITESTPSKFLRQAICLRPSTTTNNKQQVVDLVSYIFILSQFYEIISFL
jgi:hypothetical protein